MATTRKPATLVDVARLAGVAHQTVSRVVNGSDAIRPRTRALVETAMAELDYHPNLAARALATSRPHRIGALASEILERSPLRVINAAAETAREFGYVLDIVSVDPQDAVSLTQAIDTMNASQPAGVFVMTPTDLVMSLVSPDRFNVPSVFERNGDSIATDDDLDHYSYALVVDHLLDLGHRAICHVAGPASTPAARAREACLFRRVGLAGGHASVMGGGDWSSAWGYRAGQSIDVDGVTAIAAANDQIALGLLRALDERGVRVPQDVSVSGFDDIPESGYFQPPLTTVAVNVEAIGRGALLELLAELDGVEAPMPERVARLVVRASTAPVRN